MNKTLLSISLASLFTALAGSAFALEQRPVLSLEVAKKMAAACEAKAKQEGWKMNIAIVDTGGSLKYFLRQDDAFLKSIEIAQLKAGTSAGFPFSTKQIGEITTKIPGIAFGQRLVVMARRIDCINIVLPLRALAFIHDQIPFRRPGR